MKTQNEKNFIFSHLANLHLNFICLGYVKKDIFLQRRRISQEIPSFPSIQQNQPQEYSQLTIIDDIIIYGKFNNKLCFYYINNALNGPICLTIENFDDVSCKLISGIFYICAYSMNSTLQLIILTLDYSNNIINKIEEKISQEYCEFKNNDIFAIYDTSVKYYKILCARNNSEVECSKLIIIYPGNQPEEIGKKFDIIPI